jgi:L-ascorbate metabolism protein UlaG (beta-lactamase superfamily)
MKIKWLGHSAFLITSETGPRIITDPYDTGRNDLKYGDIKESADIVTVSHEHSDHANTAAIKGKPRVLRSSGKVDGIQFTAVPSFHDDTEGSQRGKNTIFCFEVDGVKLCHAGDLGHILSEKQVKDIGAVDVLMLPVGGFYTIDAAMATRIVEQLHPKVIIPMHFKNERNTFPIAPVSDFLKFKKDIKKFQTSEIEIQPGSLPSSTQVWVLPPAL